MQEKKMIMAERIWIDSKNGRIAGLLQTAGNLAQAPLAVVLHGIGDHKSTPFMSAIANGLQERGIGTLRIDFNGHGESDGSFGQMTISKEVDDAVAAVAYAKALPGTGSVFLVGHSQGGVVAALAAGRLGNQLDGLQLLAPALILKDGAREGNILGGTFNPNDLPEELPIVWGVLGRHYIEDARELQIDEWLERYHGPLNIVHGTADAVVPYHYSEKLNTRNKNSRLHLLQGYGHSFEPNCSLCVKLIGDFVNETCIQ